MLTSYIFQEYLMNKSNTNEPQQHSISQFQNRVGHYIMSHPQQKAITNAILADLVIDCNLPLSIVENKSFWHCSLTVEGIPRCHCALDRQRGTEETALVQSLGL